MPIDLAEFARKLRSYRAQRQLTPAELVAGTGISIDRFERFEAGDLLPTGDEVLILADFFQCDYRFFVSNEKLAAFQQTETLYRKFGDEFTKNDRLSIQEFFFLCECEAFLLTELSRKIEPFTFTPAGSFYRGTARKPPRLYAGTFRTGPMKSRATCMPISGVWASTSSGAGWKTRASLA